MNQFIIKHLWALSLLLLTALPLKAAEVVTYYHNDYLGSPIASTDSSGAVVWQQTYDPWGLKLKTNTDARGYTGNWLDEETGLADHKARWYTSSIGRFTAIDPVKWHESNIHSFNRYSYSNNNPYRFDDRDGKMSREVPPVSPAYQSGPELGGGGGRGSGNVSGAAFAGAVIHSMSSLLPGNIYKPIGSVSGAQVKSATPAKAAATKGPDKAPDFIVSPGGTAFPVPKGASGPTSVVNPGGKTTGSAFTGGKGGANGQVDTIRIMNPTPARGKSPGYPNGYIKYENRAGQGVDPYTGRTLPNKNSHFPID